MGYQVLARKWRPNKFSELVGQEHVVSAITHALNNDRLHHAYLFTGTRGVGKTTIARIFSKSLNCEVGQSAEPCGKCDVCVSIDQGSFVDLLEIDAASRTKVEDTRELLDNVQYKPTRGRYKVYLIDEVHMLSKHSFNALLKTLEEPPPHVKFLLATTDPQKLPITILSRCLQFNLKALSREQIANQLAFVLNEETIQFESSALQLLARAAHGSMRDALSLTDQAVAQGNNNVSQQTVTDMLGLMDKQVLLKLLNAVISKNQTELFVELEKLVDQSPDYGQVLSELSSLLHQVALTQWAPEACKLETTSARAIYQLAKQLQPEHVQLLYKLVLEGKKELPLSVDGRTCLEMTLLRMMSFAPKSPATDGIQSSITNAPASQPIAEENTVEDIVEDTQPENSAAADDLPVDDNAAIVESLEEVPPPIQDYHEESTAPEVYPNEHYDVVEMNREQAELEEQKNNAAMPSQESTSGLEKTQALLALRQKLANTEAQPTEDKSPVKKSLDTFIPPTSSNRKEDTAGIEHSTNAEEQLASNDVVDEEPPPWVMENPIGQTQPTTATEAESNYQSSNEYNAEVVKEDAVTEHGEQPVVHNTQELQQEPTDHVELAPNESSPDNQTAVVDADLSKLPPYLPNGDKLTHCSQIDKWSRLIDSSSLGGLNKQIALNATHALVDNTLNLIVDGSQQHLISDASTLELKNALSEALGKEILIEIIMGEPNNTPNQIQDDINRMRQSNAEHVVSNDQTINELVNAFDATVEQASIKAR